MKKLLLIIVLTAFSSWLFAQDVYLGAEEPANFISHVSQQGSNSFAPNLVCPPGALNENEPDIQDDGLDTVDGGCNSNPPVFIDINIGDTYCGRTNTYLFSGGNRRDTDWYRITLTETKNMHWSSLADCPINLIIVREDGGCSVTSIAHEYNIPAGTVGEVTATLAPGTYYFWIGLPVFTGWENGADYQVSLHEQSASVVPLSDWAVYLTILLIGAFSIFLLYKRRIA